ncbi:MAG: hypothetical protein J7621_00345 [Niastella sp.]|nr:hypothetical protein [Niastella sp.]
MFKRAFLLGIVSGALAGVASLVYAWRYREALGVDFSTVAATTSIIAASVGGGVLAALGYVLSYKLWKDKGEIIFNLVFTILSFASILAPLAVRLPLDVEMPELFPGLTVPMHFFPALGWFTLKPLFIKQEIKN